MLLELGWVYLTVRAVILTQTLLSLQHKLPCFLLLYPWPCMATCWKYVLHGSSLKVCATCLIAWAPGHISLIAQRISERWHRSAYVLCLDISYWKTHR